MFKKFVLGIFILGFCKSAHAAVGGITFPINFLTVQDEGITLSNKVSTLNFTGTPITCTVDGGTVTCTVVASGGVGGGVGALVFQQGTGGSWSASVSSLAVKSPLQFDFLNGSATLTLPTTAQMTIASMTVTGTITTTDTVRVGTMSIIGSSLCINSVCYSLLGDGTSGFFLQTDGNHHLSFVVQPDVSGTTTTRLNNLDSSTATLTTAINSTAAAVTNYHNSLNTTTGTFNTRLNNLDSSTSTIFTSLGSTWTILNTRANNLDSSTATLQTAINSTYTVANAALQQGYVIVSSNIASGAVTSAKLAANISISSLSAGNFTSTGSIFGLGTVNFSSNVIISTLTVSNASVTVNGVPYLFPASQGGSNQVLANNGAGTLSWATQTGGGGGGSIVVQQGAGGTYSGAMSSASALNDVVFDIRTGSFNIKVDLSTANTRLGNLDSSTATLTNQILLLATASVSGGGGGVKSLYLRSTFDTSNASSYFLMLTTPATTAEVTKTASVASSNGLVMLSSHSTLSAGMGQDVVTLPAGFWQFVMFAGLDSIVNQTDLVCNLSTMSRTGTNKFQFLAATVTNVNTLTPSQFTAETVLTSDVSISTDDRVVLDIYAKTSSVIARTVTLALEGTARVSRIGTTVERNPTFISLNDTPQTYIGQSGKFAQVNPGETAMLFNTIDTMTAITRDNNLDASTQTLTSYIGTVDSAKHITSTAIASNIINISSMSVAQFTSTGNVTLPQGTITASTGVFTTTPLAMTSGGTGISKTNFKASFSISPAMWSATKTSGTAVVQSSETPTNLANFDQMQFVNLSTPFAYASKIMPMNYDGSTITWRFSWLASSGTVGKTSTMTLACQGLQNKDPVDSPYGTAVGINSDFVAANQVLISSQSASVTCAGHPGGGNLMLFELGRLGSDSFDAFLQALDVMVLFTKNSFTE